MALSIFWTASPTLFTLANLDGHRARFMVAEKLAPVETRILLSPDEAPNTLQAVNPRNIYPILADKQLICTGSALDELINERYPHPPLLSILPVVRAQQRAIAAEIAHWYPLTDPTDIVSRIYELVPQGDQAFLFSNELSIVDVAAAPFLWKHRSLIPTGRLAKYATRLFARESFRMSLAPQTATVVTSVYRETIWTGTVAT